MTSGKLGFPYKPGAGALDHTKVYCGSCYVLWKATNEEDNEKEAARALKENREAQFKTTCERYNEQYLFRLGTLQCIACKELHGKCACADVYAAEERKQITSFGALMRAEAKRRLLEQCNLTCSGPCKAMVPMTAAKHFVANRLRSDRDSRFICQACREGMVPLLRCNGKHCLKDLPHSAFSATQLDKKKTDERRCRTCIAKEAAEVAKAFNKLQCSCGNVFSMEDYPKNLRNHIQSNEQQGRCPTCMAERAAKKRKRETYLRGACTSEITDMSQHTDSQIKYYKKR